MNGNRSLCPNPHLDRHALNPYFAIFMFLKIGSTRQDKTDCDATAASVVIVSGTRACESVPSTKLSVHIRHALGSVYVKKKKKLFKRAKKN